MSTTVTASQPARTLETLNANIATARFMCVGFAFSAASAFVGALWALLQNSRIPSVTATAANVTVSYSDKSGQLFFPTILFACFVSISLYGSMKHRELVAERQSISN